MASSTTSNPSELIPLATVAGAFITACFALWTARRASNVAWHTSYTNPRLDAVGAYLDAVYAYTQDHHADKVDAAIAASARVRLVFFSSGRPIELLDQIDDLLPVLVATCPIPGAPAATGDPGQKFSADQTQLNERHRRYEETLRRIFQLRSDFVDAVSVWLADPGNATRNPRR
ncbi:hypothetical protein OH749_31315 (plasmid) [Streptomyces albidoflavus]|uniref:hypothetical protein n=1 Tax=Streptomyces albidoflavus TaxID=1886 RepID=UPI002F911D6A|nr:hypothetical protein OH749_31315 [Streptomyces albidoflavus]